MPGFFDLALATALILAPGDADLPDAPPVSLRTFQRLALQLELMDPRERGYLFARPGDFAADLKLLRRRAHELADAPPLCDHERWPERSLCDQAMQHNREYRQWLEDRRWLDRDGWIDEAVRESQELYAVWDLVRDAKCAYYYVTVRRKALRDLRERIGPHSYYAGGLPPPVPVWRFWRVED